MRQVTFLAFKEGMLFVDAMRRLPSPGPPGRLQFELSLLKEPYKSSFNLVKDCLLDSG